MPFVNCFYSILATVLQPESTTGGTLCSKLTEIKPNRCTPLSMQSGHYREYMIGKRITNIC